MISKIQTPSRRRGFTLIELLVVITIIGIIATFSIVAIGKITQLRKISTARGELGTVEAALENYKAQYGVYPPGNHNPDSDYDQPPTPWLRASMVNQLYYELSGTTLANNNFTTLDGSASIPNGTANTPPGSVMNAYGVSGFVNCTKGGGEDTSAAKNFLPGLSSKMISGYFTNVATPVVMLVTSVGGPDDKYQPLQVAGQNPIRYVYPGVQNPGSYDLWVQLVISGKTNLVCNWSKTAQINTAFP